MDTDTIVWIVIGVLAVLLVAGVALWATRRGTQYRDERNRARAEELRKEAQAREPELRRNEAQAHELQAEADKKAAEAERLRAMAKDREHKAQVHRERFDATVRKADELDPDVQDTKHRR